MKKITLFLILMLTLSSQAQIADGSVAPDFTGTDLDGNVHNLQTYLNQGKTVILNISATWCGPCWSYSQTKALSDIYYSYGPEGSDEVVILYVEGDSSTGLDELNGISGNTVGDWVSNSPYPIIDSASIASQYQISYFPTVYRICPDGFVYEMGQLSNSQIVNNINTNCSGTLQGVSNHAAVTVDDIVVCENGETVDATIKVKNYGNNNISSYDVDFTSEGITTNVSQNFNLSQFQEQSFNLSSVVGNNNINNAIINNINNTSPYNSNLSNSTFTVDVPNATSDTNLTVEVTTDFYPSEMTWSIKDENGVSILSGGPYQPGTADSFGGGGPDANVVKTYSLTVPTTAQCFTVELFDSYGDGWLYDNSPGDPLAGVKILDSNSALLFDTGEVGDFGSAIAYNNSFRHDSSLGLGDNEISLFSIYPNPTSDVVNFNSINELQIDVTDINGKRIMNKTISPNGQLDISNLNSGIYFVTATDGINSNVEKLIVK